MNIEKSNEEIFKKEMDIRTSSFIKENFFIILENEDIKNLFYKEDEKNISEKGLDASILYEKEFEKDILESFLEGFSVGIKKGLPELLFEIELYLKDKLNSDLREKNKDLTGDAMKALFLEYEEFMSYVLSQIKKI